VIVCSTWMEKKKTDSWFFCYFTTNKTERTNMAGFVSLIPKLFTPTSTSTSTRTLITPTPTNPIIRLIHHVHSSHYTHSIMKKSMSTHFIIERKARRAAACVIGDEILSGKIQDANTFVLAQFLFQVLYFTFIYFFIFFPSNFS